MRRCLRKLLQHLPRKKIHQLLSNPKYLFDSNTDSSSSSIQENNIPPDQKTSIPPRKLLWTYYRTSREAGTVGESHAKKICASRAKTTQSQLSFTQKQHPNQQVSQPPETRQHNHPLPPQNNPTHLTSPPLSPLSLSTLTLSPPSLSLSLFQNYLTIFEPEHNRRIGCHAVRLKTLKSGAEHNRSRQQKLKTSYR